MRGWSGPRRRAAAVLAAGLVLGAAATTWAAATGPEPALAPAGGGFDLDGRGYGHGRGMSQWGAQGAASLGVPYEEILRAYYPGTTLEQGADTRRLRVGITADADGDLQVRAEPGLGLRTGGDGGLLQALPDAVGGVAAEAWRVRTADGALRLEVRLGGAWAAAPAGLPAPAAPVAFAGPAGTARLVLPGGTQRDYRGELWAVQDPKNGRVRTVNAVSLGDYLRGVVPSEAPSSWRPDALRAQAVAARSYALWRSTYLPLPYADICDSTACQAYRGVRTLNGAGRVTATYEAAGTDDAVRVTAGQFLSYKGNPAMTEFSSSNGGWSRAGDRPYLPAREDPWDGAAPNKVHSWRAFVPSARLEQAWPQIGGLVSIQVRSRDGVGPWDGRVTSVRLKGKRGSVTVPGAAFASAAGIRHRWFRAHQDAAG